MKIEIDLNEILFDEAYGPETLQESVQRQVIDKIKTQVLQTSVHKVQEEIDKQIANTVSETIKERLPELFSNLLDEEYTPISNYGARSEPTSFRKELIKTIQSEMVYKREAYSDRKTAFTKTVDSIVDSIMVGVKKDFNTQVTSEVAKQAFDEALKLLKTKLGV